VNADSQPEDGQKHEFLKKGKGVPGEKGMIQVDTHLTD
jgi:hypothetical protein